MHSARGSGQLVAERYRLLHQLGRGAMGIVWRGRDELLDRDVAVKQIALPAMASDAETRLSYQRTLREARTAARLSHPGVITVFDVVEEDGVPWIVMELIKARPLDQVIAEDGPLPPAQAAQLGLSLLDALSAAHAAGVLHRDVKPSNVLISPEGKAILTDFGIATVQGDPGMTQAGMIAGTPGFSPPERVRGADATPASDLWSLGATLYAAVEGRGPFDRAGGSAAIVASIATEPAPKAPSAGPLSSVIDMLLRADPAERPDAATTRRLLTAAWVDARHGGYLGVGLRAFSQRSPDQAIAVAEPLPGVSGPDATTATQVVTVPAAEVAEVAGADSVGVAMSTGEAPAPTAEIRRRSAAATNVVPDLMATPVFADLKMPDSAGSAGGSGEIPDNAAPAAGTKPGSLRPLALNARGLAGLLHSRRGLVFTAPIAVSAVVAGIVFLAFPGYSNLLGQGRLHAPSASKVSSGAQSGGLGTRHHGGTAPGSGGAGVPPGSHQPSGGPSPARPSASDRPTPQSPSGSPPGTSKPSPSATPTATASPTPSSPLPSSPKLPAGYSWDQVTAAQAGTKAGFRLGAPSTWQLTPGLHSVIKAPAGNSRLMVDMAPFAVARPVRAARRLQAAAIAHKRYRDYHPLSISPRTFHGWSAAAWTFWWKPANAARIDVTKIIFTAQTSAGSQPYVLSMSAPASHIAAANKVFAVAMNTFRPLPG
ncbi:MAG: protein kinase domain-containing protein [Streptosporangiaceae bacterium]